MNAGNCSEAQSNPQYSSRSSQPVGHSDLTLELLHCLLMELGELLHGILQACHLTLDVGGVAGHLCGVIQHIHRLCVRVVAYPKLAGDCTGKCSEIRSGKV